PGPRPPVSGGACLWPGGAERRRSGFARGCRTSPSVVVGRAYATGEGPLYRPPAGGQMIGTRAVEFEQASRLERGLVMVRWLGVVLGVYLISQTNAGDRHYFPFRASSTRIAIGYAMIAGLALAHLAICRGTAPP